MVTESYEYYSELDSLGRCGLTVACLGKDLMPSGNRGSLSSVSPSGWRGNAIYERSHLIAFSLAGETTNKKNLITGTYDLNGVMQEFEAMVAAYIKNTNNHVMYRVEPIFEGNNLVASGVQMEAYSVEDNGEGICFNVYIYNSQDFCEVDYADGSYLYDPGDYTFILNKKNKKIHRTTCSSVHDIADENREGTYKTLQELVAEGYSYCGNCKPQNA